MLFEHLTLSFKYWQVQGALPDECWGGQLGSLADIPESATPRPALGACGPGEVSWTGNISGSCQLWDRRGPPSLRLAAPFKAGRLVFGPADVGHKSVDPFFVLPKDLATWPTRRRLLVHFFIIHAASGD